MDLLLRSHHQSFLAAVRSGDPAAVRRLVDYLDGGGAAFSALMALQSDRGETALHIAAEHNLVDVFLYIASFCDYPTATIRSGLDLDAFHVAAKQGNTGIVKEFLRLWPEICRVCDGSNTSPLYSAAVKDHFDVVNAILDVDPSTIRIVRKNGKTALHTSARIGYHRIVKALLERDPEVVTVRDKKGQTALHMAVKGRNPVVVEEMLLTDDSILNVRDKKGNTALHIATRKWRPQMVSLLLSYKSIDVNAVNNQNETAMDLAEKIPYGEEAMDIMECLTDAGARNARNVGQIDETSELRRTVSDIKHDVYSQLIQNAKTHKRVTGIAKELRKLHREAVQNTINSVTVVAVLIASIAFVAIFNLPGQYIPNAPQAGTANIATDHAPQAGTANIAADRRFHAFCLLNATALFISLAVVVVQITLVAWETSAQKQVVSVVNKLMWAACLSTCGAFLSLAFVVVSEHGSWMAVTLTLVGVPIMVGTLLTMSYLVLRQRFKFGDDSERRIKRTSGSKSFSWSHYSAYSTDDLSDHEKKIYAL